MPDKKPQKPYTRQEALDDGILIDISKQAQKHGIEQPVAITTGLYYRCMEPDQDPGQAAQSLDERMHEVLTTLGQRLAGRGNDPVFLSFRCSFLLRACPIEYEEIEIFCASDDVEPGEAWLTLMGEDDF